MPRCTLTWHDFKDVSAKVVTVWQGSSASLIEFSSLLNVELIQYGP
jgi:hypothetical protein